MEDAEQWGTRDHRIPHSLSHGIRLVGVILYCVVEHVCYADGLCSFVATVQVTLDTQNGGENSTLVEQVVGDWTAMRVNALPNMNEYLLRRLDDDSAYQLQVLAKNPIGYSDPETFLFRTPPGALLCSSF